MTTPSPASTTPPDIPAAAVLPAALHSFSYTAQTVHGLRFNGTLEAPDGAAAVRILESMQLRVTGVNVADRAKSPPALRDDPFLVFNQQLAELSRAGMPIEKGIRIVSTDIRRGRFARAVAAVSGELAGGVPLADAFAKHRGAFPPIYGRLLEAAAGGNNLPGVLLNLGRQMEMQNRIRAVLWRAVARPMMTLCALLVIIAFIGLVVIPQFRVTFADLRIKLPLMTDMVMAFAGVAPYLAAVGITMLAIFFLSRGSLRAAGAEAAFTDRHLLRIPFIGPVVRFNLIARWLDGVRIGVLAGLELPAAIELAADATASPMLRHDGAELIAAIADGKPLTSTQGKLLPPTVPAAIEFSAGGHSLHDTLQTLCDLYARQAELRLERIPAILTPVLVMLIALLIGCIAFGLLLPLILAIQELSKGFGI